MPSRLRRRLALSISPCLRHSRRTRLRFTFVPARRSVRRSCRAPNRGCFFARSISRCTSSSSFFFEAYVKSRRLMPRQSHARDTATSRFSKHRTSWRRSLTSGVFFEDLPHDVDLDVPLGQQPLEPRVLLLQFPRPLHIRLGHRPELPLPDVKLVGAEPVLPGKLLGGLGPELGFAKKPDDLFIRKSLLNHRPFRPVILLFKTGTF